MAFLHIAQKNSIAKQVADILSKNTKRTIPTLSKFNPVFQFELDGQKHHFSSVRGHVFTYVLPDECKSWSSYDNEKILTRQVSMLKKNGQDMDDLVANLEKLSKNKQHLILWLDCDREGEAIAYEVIQIATKINPYLKIQRARFAAVTFTDIMNAYNNLVQPNKLEADAVNYRIQIDFRMGCAFTRYQSVAFSKYFQFKDHSVLSYGPCQIPTLGFVVNRYLQINNFVPEKYWYIAAKAIFNQTTSIQLKWERRNLKVQLEANVIYMSVFHKASDPQIRGRLTGKILERNSNQKKKYRPFPLTTVNFQKLATSKLRMSSAEAMKIAQSLYQKGFISYPRTETNAFPKTMNMETILQKLTNSETYNSYINKLLHQNKFMKPKIGNQNDQAHTPIHPVKPAERSQFTESQWKIYDLITRHFLACCSKDAIGMESEIIADIGGQRFRASHLSVKQKNYLEIYPFDKWVQSEFPGQIPSSFPVSLKLMNDKTHPPSYLSESDLIDLMQKNQIGTDSTIHEHIETIQDRKYAIKTNNTFKPTNLGASIIITYRNLGIRISQCQIRRMIERKMNEIAQGKIQKETAVLDTLKDVIPIYSQLKRIENDWVKNMRDAMRQHENLSQIQVQQRQKYQNRAREGSSEQQQVAPNQIVCYICKTPGHLAPFCPERMQIKPRRQQQNHLPIRNPDDLTNQHGRMQNNLICFICQQSGHLANNCPSRVDKKGPKVEKPKRQNKQKREQQNKVIVCYKCKKEGHYSTSCPDSTNSEIKCFICQQIGHTSNNCTQKVKGNGIRRVKK